MEFSHIISFICGGLISAIIFYPKHNMKKKTVYLAGLLAYQYYHGIRTRQENPDIPAICNEEHLRQLSDINSWVYAQSAQEIIKKLEKL